MTLEKLSMESSNFYIPRFEIEIQNQKLRAEMSKAILDVTVREKIDEGASFELTVHDEFDMKAQEFKWLDHELFNVGNKISVKMGYGNRLETMIIGNITGLEPSFFAGDMPTLKVKGQDLSYDYMKRPNLERVFVNKTYSEIAKTIASEAGLLAVVGDTRLRQTSRKRNDETYYAFLTRLGREVGFEFRINGQTMYFARPKTEEKEILVLELGKDIINFVPSMRNTGALVEVEVRGYNPRDPRKPIIGSAQAGSGKPRKSGKKVVTDIIVNSKEHADAIAKAILEKAEDTLVEGKGECIGIPQIRVGVNIRIEKIGKRFSKKYYVKEVTHIINNSGYRTQFSVIMRSAL